MNIINIIVIGIIILLFVIGVIILITNNNIIENFALVDAPEQNFPPLIENTFITIPSSIPHVNDRDLLFEYINEMFDVIAPENTEKPFINGYGTLYVTSSFTMNNQSTYYSLSQILRKNNNMLITLNSAKENSVINMLGITGNYIKITYPEKFRFKRLIITRSNDTIFYPPVAGVPQDSIKIKIYTGIGDITECTTTVNPAIPKGNLYEDEYIAENITETSTIFIYFTAHYKTYNIRNIQIFGYPINKPTKVFVSIPTESEGYNTTLSDNPYSQFEEISTESSDEQDIDIVQYMETTIMERFLTLLRRKKPLGIYNANITTTGDNVFVADALGRLCRNAIITGPYTIETDANNVRYISGKPETVIIFPKNSLSQKYTICGITKYTTSRNRNRIITTNTYDPNWLLGHWNNRKPCMHNNEWKISDLSYVNANETEWRVSCCKSTATNYKNSIIINNVALGTRNVGIISNMSTNARLTINNPPPGWSGEKSDFGFAYLFVWDSELTDMELQLVSSVLNDYVANGIDINYSTIIPPVIMDGLTKETAGISAVDIKNDTCTNKDGMYWIKNANGIPKKIYCIMDSTCFGGGWMLAIKGANNSGVFAYNGSAHASNGYNPQLGRNNIINYWTRNNTLNEEDATMFNTDAKFHIYNTYPVSQCLAMFDKENVRGKLTFPNKPEYGWMWWASIFYNQRTTLLDFFRNDITQVFWTSMNPNYNYQVGNQYAIRLPGNAFSQRFTDNNCTFVAPYPRDIWSYQEGVKVIGFNIKAPYWGHSVRWGGSFNNEQDFNSNDVSGGIGLQNLEWNAGDIARCCESSRGTSSQMSFKWFIK